MVRSMCALMLQRELGFLPRLLPSKAAIRQVTPAEYDPDFYRAPGEDSPDVEDEFEKADCGIHNWARTGYQCVASRRRLRI